MTINWMLKDCDSNVYMCLYAKKWMKQANEKRWYVIEKNGSIRSRDQIQRQWKKGEDFAVFFFLLFRKREKLYFSLFFSLFINTTTIVFDAEERVELFSDDTNNDQFCVYVTKSLWSNRIVLGNWNYNIRNCAEAIYTYIFFRKDVC